MCMDACICKCVAVCAATHASMHYRCCVYAQDSTVVTAAGCNECCCVLLCIAVCAVRCSVLQCDVVCCSHSMVLTTGACNCWAFLCGVLQCVAACCNVLQCVATVGPFFVVCYSLLQCVAVCCSVLQLCFSVQMPVLFSVTDAGSFIEKRSKNPMKQGIVLHGK